MRERRVLDLVIHLLSVAALIAGFYLLSRQTFVPGVLLLLVGVALFVLRSRITRESHSKRQ